MPQASDEMRAKIEAEFGDPISDAGPYRFLRERGFVDKAGWWSKPGVCWDDLTDKEKLALEFLADEWDYAYDFRRPEDDAAIKAGLAPAPGTAWRDLPVTAGFLADVFDAYCGADGHNLVAMKAMSALKQKTP